MSHNPYQKNTFYVQCCHLGFWIGFKFIKAVCISLFSSYWNSINSLWQIHPNQIFPILAEGFILCSNQKNQYKSKNAKFAVKKCVSNVELFYLWCHHIIELKRGRNHTALLSQYRRLFSWCCSGNYNIHNVILVICVTILYICDLKRPRKKFRFLVRNTFLRQKNSKHNFAHNFPLLKIIIFFFVKYKTMKTPSKQ